MWDTPADARALSDKAAVLGAGIKEKLCNPSSGDTDYGTNGRATAVTTVSDAAVPYWQRPDVHTSPCAESSLFARTTVVSTLQILFVYFLSILDAFEK